MKKIDEVTRKRLIYVKRLFTHGHEHISQGSEFDRMIAIHHFDNAIELLLKCVATHYDISFRKPLYVPFPKLWDEVSKEYKKKVGTELPRKTEVFQLHDFRCDVQHWGVSPVSLDIANRFDVYTVDFMQAILDSVFNLDYNNLFMSSLVRDKVVRRYLFDAEKHLATERWKEAIHRVSIAFAIAKAKAQRKVGLPSTPLTLSSLYHPFDELGRMKEALRLLGDTVAALALHLDFEKYLSFQKKTPVVLLPSEENPIIQEIRKMEYTRENAIFCVNFALNSILRWGL